MFQETELSYNPGKVYSETCHNGTYIYFEKGIFRTLICLEREALWGIGLFHPTKLQNNRIFKDRAIFYNTPIHRENIILIE